MYSRDILKYSFPQYESECIDWVSLVDRSLLPIEELRPGLGKPCKQDLGIYWLERAEAIWLLTKMTQCFPRDSWNPTPGFSLRRLLDITFSTLSFCIDVPSEKGPFLSLVRQWSAHFSLRSSLLQSSLTNCWDSSAFISIYWPWLIGIISTLFL